jgi:radical SAM superfamily enzyme YgiQ (UPF0313 family)
MIKKPRITLLWTLYSPLPYQKMAPNLSIAYLAKTLEQHNFIVSCIDCNLLVYDKWDYKSVKEEDKSRILDDLVKEAEETRPDILGIGYWTEGVSFVREFARLIKKRNPRLTIILGGPSATFLPKEVLNFIPEADYIVRGEGELTLLDLVTKITKGDSTKNVLGISYKSDKVRVINNPNRPLIKNLDSLPLIDFENFTYLGKHEGLNLLTSRGCPFNCFYCSANNFYGCYRFYSPAYVVNQIKHLLKLYHIRHVAFSDDNVIVSPLRAIKLFGLLAEENLDCELPTGARVDSLNKEVFAVLAKAKVPWLTIGIENIIPKVLKYYNRTQDSNSYLLSVTRTIKLIKKHGMGAAFCFVMGAPIETEDDILANLHFMKGLFTKNFVIYASMLRLVPGSYFWYQYLDKKINIFPLNITTTNFPFDDQYLDLEWVCPANFAFKHNFYSNQQFIEIRGKILKEVSKFNIDPATLPQDNFS